MQIKSKFAWGFISFILMGILLGPGIAPVNAVELSPETASAPEAAVSGSYHRVGWKLYEQSLGGVVGIAVEGINAIDGQTDVTDLLMVGTTGLGSWRGLQGYYANESLSLPKIINDDDAMVSGIVKFEDTNDHNMDIIYAIRDGTTEGGLYRQRGVDPSYSTAPEVYGDGGITMADEPVISTCIGNFDSDASLEVLTISMNGMVRGFANLNSPTSLNHLADLDWYNNPEYRFVKNRIIAIGNIDDVGVSYDDVIVGHDQNVTAVSSWPSYNNIIWSTDIGSPIGSVSRFPDIDGNGKEEVVASTTSSIVLLNGTDGTVLITNSSVGSHLRDLQVFNDVNGDSVPEIITGNWQSDVLIMDMNYTSPTFGQILINTSLGSGLISSLLMLEDLDGDLIPEMAVGGAGVVGVLCGANATWYWKKGVYGSWLAPSYPAIYDMALLDDRDGDGYKDFAVTGGYEGSGGGVFIYKSQGALEFWPDLTASGYVDSLCNTNSYIFEFRVIAYQVENLVTTAEVTIDGTTYPMVKYGMDVDWTDGMNYTFDASLADGDHTYSFKVEDSNGDIVNINPATVIHVGDDCDDPVDPDNGGGSILDSIPLNFGPILAVSIFAVTIYGRKIYHKVHK